MFCAASGFLKTKCSGVVALTVCRLIAVSTAESRKETARNSQIYILAIHIVCPKVKYCFSLMFLG